MNIQTLFRNKSTPMLRLPYGTKKTVIASKLTNGPHTVVITVTGRKNAAATGALVQLPDKWTPG